MKETGQVNPDVYAIGDASMIKGDPLPATAQGMTIIKLVKIAVDRRLVFDIAST